MGEAYALTLIAAVALMAILFAISGIAWCIDKLTSRARL